MTQSEYIKFLEEQRGLLDPISTIASGVSSLGSSMDNISEQNAIQNVDRPDLATFVVGNTWQDIINNDDRLNQGFQTIQDNIVDYSGVKNNNNLLNTWNPNSLQNEVNYTSPDGGQVWGDTLGDMGKGAGIGAGIGSIIPGVGTAVGAGVGAVAGALSGIFRGFFGDKNNKENAVKLNKAITKANINQINDFYNTVQQNNQRQQRQAMMNYFQDGGDLGNGVTMFNTGNTHESNPLGGVPQGIAPDNLPNMVEEGELKYDDYIYSARLKANKKLLKDHLLPEKYEGLSFAQIGEKLQKESENRVNDPISKETLNTWMSRLKEAQEEHKAKIEERKLAKALDKMPTEDKAILMASLMQQVQPQEGIDLSQPMYADGGKIYIKPSKRGTFTAAAKKRGMGVQEFASKVIAHPENYSEAMRKKAQFARNFGGHKHSNGGHLAQNGMYLNLSPYIDTSSPYYGFETIEPEAQTPIKLNVAPLNVWKVDPTIPLNLQSKEELDKDLNSAIDSASNKAFGDMSNDEIDTYLSAQKSNINRGELAKLRYAPAIGAGISALTTALQPIDYSLPNELRSLSSQFRPIGAPHIGGYRRYNPYDINLGDAENIALQAAALRANRGQSRTAQGALNIAAINAAQKIAAQRNLAWQQANEANRLATDQYNLGIDQINANLTQAYDQLNQQINNNRINMLARAAQEADNSRTAWSNMYNATHENFFNQLGNVGRDEWNRNQFLAWLRQHPAVARDMGIDIG